MKNLLLSTQGRLLTLACGVAIGGAGLSKLFEDAGLLVGAVATLFALVLMIVGLALSVEEHFGSATLVVVVLPWLTFLGQVGAQLAPRALGWPLVVASIPFFAFAARGHASARGRSQLEVARAAS